MAVGFGTIGTPQGSATSPLTLTMPASIAAGDLLVACIVSKYPTITPSAAGWAIPTNGQGSGGAGAPGLNSGTVDVTILVKEAVGGEGDTAFTVTGLNCVDGVVARYTKAGGTTWSYAATNGADTSAGSGFSVTGAGDPGALAGDMLIVVAGQNGDGSADTHAVSQTGMTWGSMQERLDHGTSSGDDIGIQVSDFVGTGGPSSAAPVYTSTIGFSGAGAAVFLRIREVASGRTTKNTRTDHLGMHIGMNWRGVW